MKIWQYSDIKNQVLTELDLQIDPQNPSQSFISPTEILGYYNDAVEDAVAQIHGIYEDYFLTSFQLPMLQGQSDYSLPTNIYANKIRSVIYNDGSLVYPVKRVRGSHEFEQLALITDYQASFQYYRYILHNDSAASGVKLSLYPASRITSSATVTLWYLRDASRAALDTDPCDIPEFANYLKAYMRRRCLAKINGGQPPQFSVVEEQRQRELLVDTLTQMVPDGDNTIEMDLGSYWDHS